MKLPIFSSLLVLAVAPLAVLAEEDCDKRIDDVFQKWNKRGTPGAQVAVIQHGKLVFEKGYGLANLEYDIPVTTQTIYHVASVSKQFTAMALVLLEQEGKLSLDDDLHKYLPELPDYGQRITIKQLLQHTSGIRDQWQTLALAGWRLDDVITQEQILRVLFRQKELNFPPGTRHLYSNGGYTLAAEVVARVSGKSFPEFCQEKIFKPLSMTRTHFHDDLRRIVPDRAYSYRQTDDGYEASPLNYANVGATSLFTTSSDLVRWLDNFREPRICGRAAIEKLQEPAVLANGQKIDYGLGVSLGHYRGLKTISHGGGDAGYRSFVLWFPEKELGVAVVSGLASFDSGGVANRVADVFLGDLAPEPVKPQQKPNAEPARKYITLDSKVLDQYVGHYKMDAGIEADFRRKDGKLIGEVPGQGSDELHPVATNRFFVEHLNGEIEFVVKAGGPVRLKFDHDGSTITGERTAVTPWEPTGLDQYQGVYWSEELEAQYTVTLKDGKLTVNHIRHGEIELLPAAPDRFRTREWLMPEVNFVRDSANHVSAMMLGGGRVTGIRFERKVAAPGKA